MAWPAPSWFSRPWLSRSAGCSSSGGDRETTATLARPSSTPAPPATTPLATTPTLPPTVASTAPPQTTPPVTAPATCPSWSDPVVTGHLDHKLRETSGLAASRLNPGVLWAHNDSGNAPVLYALDEAGSLLAELPLPVPALDWEDIAAGPGPDGTPYLWVADTGDNLTLRPNVTIYRLPEPTFAPGATVATLPAEGLERITVAYPDGPHDVETLLVDPVTGDAFLVGKETDQDKTVPVFRLPATDLGDGARVEAELVGRVVGRESRGNGPTAGDISADGTLVLVSNGREGFLWLRDPALPLAAVFAAQPSAPCSVRPGGGEAVAFSVDGAAPVGRERG